MFLSMSGGFIIKFIITHRIVMTAHHLNIFEAFHSDCIFINIISLLVRKFGDCIDNRSSWWCTYFPMRITQSVFYLWVNFCPLEVIRRSRKVYLMGGIWLKAFKERASQTEMWMLSVTWKRRRIWIIRFI